VAWDEQFESSATPMDAVVRLICHLIIDNIPRQGLAEVSESMVSMWQYYSEPRSADIPSLPPVVNVTTLEAVTRPAFNIVG